MYERFISSSILTGCWLAAKSVISDGLRAGGSERKKSKPAKRLYGLLLLRMRLAAATGGSMDPMAQVSSRRPDPAPLHVEVFHVQGIVLDELAARLDLIA